MGSGQGEFRAAHKTHIPSPLTVCVVYQQWNNVKGKIHPETTCIIIFITNSWCSVSQDWFFNESVNTLPIIQTFLMGFRVDISFKCFIKTCLDCILQAYMGRGLKDQNSFDAFDISAILNFMHHCKHFKSFTDGQYLTKVKKIITWFNSHTLLFYLSLYTYTQTW